MKGKIVCFCFVAVAQAIFWPFAADGEARANPENSVPAEVFDGMPACFRPEKAVGIYARYQFKIRGPTGGDWWILISGGTYKIGRGTIDKPDVTFESSDKDWVRLSNKTLSGAWAFLSGRLKITGDQSLARKLHTMFP